MLPPPLYFLSIA